MYEIIGEMVLCLVLALLLGAIIGWLLSRALYKEEFFEDDEYHHQDEEYKDSEAVLRMKQIEKLYENEKSLSAEYLKTNKDLKGQLMQKNSLLANTSEALRALQAKKNSSKGNNALIKTLEDKLIKKEKELLEFENVLIKAEETIELKENEIKKLKSKA